MIKYPWAEDGAYVINRCCVSDRKSVVSFIVCNHASCESFYDWTWSDVGLQKWLFSLIVLGFLILFAILCVYDVQYCSYCLFYNINNKLCSNRRNLYLFCLLNECSPTTGNVKFIQVSHTICVNSANALENLLLEVVVLVLCSFSWVNCVLGF